MVHLFDYGPEDKVRRSVYIKASVLQKVLQLSLLDKRSFNRQVEKMLEEWLERDVRDDLETLNRAAKKLRQG